MAPGYKSCSLVLSGRGRESIYGCAVIVLVVILAIGASILIARRMGNVRAGLPADDELSKMFFIMGAANRGRWRNSGPMGSNQKTGRHLH